MILEAYEDCYDNDLAIPRDTDRIMEQFILMLLRIGAHLTKQGTGLAQMYSNHAPGLLPNTLLLGEDTDPPPSVGNDKRRNTSYLQQYPQIFMKKDSTRLRTSPPTSPDDSSKNLKRSENYSKILKIQDKFIDFKPTFELKETPLQEESEIILNDAESKNYRKQRNLRIDHDIRSESSKEEVHKTVNISEVGSNEHNKNNQANQYTEATMSHDTFDEIIERMRQCITEKCKENNELDRLSSTMQSSQSNPSTLRENGSKHEKEDPKSTSSNK